VITVHINEPDKHCPYRSIYYRDSADRILRHIWVDTDNSIVRDYLYEKRSDGQSECVVLYGADHVTPLGVREFFYDSLGRIIENIQYEICGGQKLQIQKISYFYENSSNRCNKTMVYGRTDQPIGYTLYTYDDAGIAPIGNFNMNHERIGKFDLERLF
jgi:hypothetical protein